MTKQLCFTGLKPPHPTIRTPRVAERIARRVVETVNLDDFYWLPEEIEDRVYDVAQEIIRVGLPASVFDRLHRRAPPVTDAPGSERVTHPYGWEGVTEHCHHIADEIAEEELAKAVKEWEQLK